jgi:hypothetical protein
VVACEGLAIGLHGAGDEALSLTFVKQDVAALERALTMFRVEVERARLGSDVFNELTLREPGGMAIRVIEARTFSPPAELPVRTAMGMFRAISLPCADLVEAREFWELLGMELQEVAAPWEGFSVSGTPLAYHSRADFREMALVFDGEGARDEGVWRQAGLGGGRAVAQAGGDGHLLLRGVEGVAMVVLGD